MIHTSPRGGKHHCSGRTGASSASSNNTKCTIASTCNVCPNAHKPVRRNSEEESTQETPHPEHIPPFCTSHSRRSKHVFCFFFLMYHSWNLLIMRVSNHIHATKSLYAPQFIVCSCHGSWHPLTMSVSNHTHATKSLLAPLLLVF